MRKNFYFSLPQYSTYFTKNMYKKPTHSLSVHRLTSRSFQSLEETSGFQQQPAEIQLLKSDLVLGNVCDRRMAIYTLKPERFIFRRLTNVCKSLIFLTTKCSDSQKKKKKSPTQNKTPRNDLNQFILFLCTRYDFYYFLKTLNVQYVEGFFKKK